MKRLLLATALSLAPSLAHAQPDEVGPLAVQVDAYDFGDDAFDPVNLTDPVELRAAVYSPEDLSGGPFPLVMVMHGRHPTCYDPENPTGSPNDGSLLGGTSEWPCQEGRIPIPSHEGYAFFAEQLASHGFIVVSVSANGISTFDNDSADAGATARADLLNEHLLLWVEWSRGGDGPFGDRFVGSIDFERLGAMGHSRGGEGVAAWANADVSDGPPNFIDAVLMVAPTTFNRIAFGDVDVGVILPYCDGDVFSLDGAHYFDDVRYLAKDDETQKVSITFAGANHNYFNTVWTPGTFEAAALDDFASLEEFLGPDPACGANSNTRLSAQEQQDAFVAYAAAFFRVHLGDATEFEPMLRGEVVPDAAVSADPLVSYVSPAAERLLVNAVDTEASLAENALGGAVETDASFAAFCGLAADFTIPSTYEHCVEEPGFGFGGYFEGRQPHVPGLGQLRLRLEDGEHWTNTLPEGTSAEELAVVQVRLGADFEGAPAPGTRGSLTLSLSDHAGAEATVDIAEWGDVLRPQPGSLENVLPHKLLHSLRVPLDAFEGVERTNLASITLRADGGPVSFLVSDVAFLDAVPDEPEPGTSTGAGDTSSGGAESMSGTSNDETDSETTTVEPGSGSSGSSGGSAPGGDGGSEGCGCSTREPTPVGALGLGLMGLLGLRRRRD